MGNLWGMLIWWNVRKPCPSRPVGPALVLICFLIAVVVALEIVG